MALEIPDHVMRVETARFGPFNLQVGTDSSAIESVFLRVSDAHKRLEGSPLAQVANHLEKEVVVKSIFGTNSIEGGTLSEQETEAAIELDPANVQDIEQRRAINIKAAYDLSQNAATDPGWRLDMPFIQQVHATITQEIPNDHNRPGVLRDNLKDRFTFVGNQAHGGRYKPPQFGRDIRLLLESLLEWHQQLVDLRVPVLIRAPLVHFYFELIHPFWDGNGRVGRVLEATLLHHEGFKYAPLAQARYYFDHIDHYFTLFNTCRKAEDRGKANPNTAFVSFFLDGMLTSLNNLHDRVNRLVNVLLFSHDIKRRHDEKEINARQYAIVTQVLSVGKPMSLGELRRAPWYQALYVDKTEKTRQRDLRRLREKNLITIDSKNQLWPGFVTPDNEPS